MSVLDKWLKPDAAGEPGPATSATEAPELSSLTGAQPNAQDVAKCSTRFATEHTLEDQCATANVADVANVAARGRAREAETLRLTIERDLSEGFDSVGRAEGRVISPVRWAASAIAPDEPSFEDPCPERRGLLDRRGAVFLHFCVECGRWGAYGYDTTRNHPGRWYCRLHRPE